MAKRKFSQSGSGFFSKGKKRSKRTRSGLRKTTRRKRPSLNYHEFTRYSDAVTVTTTAVTTDLVYSFSLTDVINYSEFTTLFDQYKIKMVEFKIHMISNPDSAAQPNDDAYVNVLGGTSRPLTNWYPKIWYIKDYDGGGADTLSQIKERVGVKFFVMRPNKVYTIKIRPKVLVQTYKTLTSTGYSPKGLFLDCVDNNVPHYGLNLVLDNLGLNPGDANGFRYRIEYKFHLAFKGVR